MGKIGRNAPCPCGSGKKYKRCCINVKPRSNSIHVMYKEPFKGLKYTKEDGRFRIITSAGDLDEPGAVFSTIGYDRESGKRKVTSSVPGRVVLDRLQYLSSFNAVFAIDTNTRKIKNQRISVSAIIRCHFALREGSPRMYERRESPPMIFAFKDHSTLHPEKLAWAKLFKLIESGRDYVKTLKIAVVTDHDLDNHLNFNERTKPVWGDIFLPETCTLIYASSDAKNDDVTNQLVAKCDKTTKSFLGSLEMNGSIEVGGKKITLDEIEYFPVDVESPNSVRS